MGVVLCSKHGQSGIAFVCRHVRRAVNSNEAISEIHRWRFYFDYLCDTALHYHFCLICMNELRIHGLPRSGEKSSGDQEDDHVEAILAKVWDGSDVVCSNCLYEAVGVSDLASFDESS
jgi:hypothetical protein